MNEGNAGNAQAVIDFAEKLTDERIYRTEDMDGAPNGTACMVLPEGRTIESLKPLFDEFRLYPEAARGFARLQTQDSFIKHALRYVHDDRSVIFADRTTTRFVAVFDYQPIGVNGKMSPTDVAQPDWAQHGSIYACPVSPEWKAWIGSNGKWMDSTAFAEFVEDRILDVLNEAIESKAITALQDSLGSLVGTQAQLRDLSRNLSVNVGTTVKSAQTLSSGELSIQYTEVHEDGQGQPLKLPTLFALALPVYRSGQVYQVAMRLRYRIASGKVSWMYQLHQPDDTLDRAFQESADAIADGTKVPVFLGTADNTIAIPS